ncbi:MAG TPA: ATP-dependent RNA helicase HrpA [Burkholderiales bacterium]|nr:ATP-dependent RNA helicase HrpA [Burkholderiales bacterium]
MSSAPTSPENSSIDWRSLRATVERGMLQNRASLRGRLRRLEEAARGGKDVAAELATLLGAATASAERAAERRRSIPKVAYPEELPISARRGEIAAAIRDHQVVIVSGETGSGKTTQLPKICLELGRGVQGIIGHTQPRRIAARSVAARVASELRTPLGESVGFQVRFTDKTGAGNHIRLMTDGILLAQTQADRWLSQYDTLIIDEAHERSLNIDFLLGYIKQLLPRRPELKLIITSATIDAARFSAHFGNAPVIEVSGRLYPVDVWYRPFDEDDEDEHEIDLPQAIVNAVDEVTARTSTGDVLVFLPGEREIRDAAEALRKHHAQGVDILPLFARLSAQEQERIFSADGNARRIVLATNVAETSLTVPGIRFVVDSGLARINRYSYRNKVELLQVEKISRASANQRAGRCGRVMNGICVRLYGEQDFAERAEFTDPEILRSSLASVILRMGALKLGDVEDFPFVDAPSSRMIADGYQLLAELGAVDENRALTPIGQQLAKLPIDPRVGRMLVAARQEGCLAEVLVIAAALSVQDPRERPMDKQEAVTQAHAEFLDEKSDFLSYLRIWKWFGEALAHKKSNRRLVQDCHERFLSYLRLREWRELHAQLSSMVAEMDWRPNEKEAKYEEIHRALLAGLLGNIGFKSEEAGLYLGARQIKFVLSPASALKRKGPKWIMAAELTETTRLYARCVAAIEPEWIERLGEHLAKRSYREPHWSKDSGSVVASEQVSVYGLVVVPKRRVQYGPIAPKEARELFIRGALVAGQYAQRAEFLDHNRHLIEDVQQLEHKSRRHDVLVDEEAIFAFYAQRIPDGIWSVVDFEKWRRQAERANPKLLFLNREYLMRHAAEQVTENLFPDAMTVGMQTFDLAYRFDPGHALDGVTMIVPLHLLNQVDEHRCEWLVPGLLRDKLTQLIKGLPKGIRKHFVPVPQVVTSCLEILDPEDGPLLEALSKALFAKVGVEVPLDAWDAADLPAHLLMNFRVVDENGAEIAGGRDLPALRTQLGVKARRTFSETASTAFERKGATTWDFGELPEQVEVDRGKGKLIGYPAIVDEGKSVGLTLLDTEAEAEAATHRGLRRLFQLALPEQMKSLARNPPGFNELQLRYMLMDEQGGKPDKAALADRLRDELVTAICDRAFFVEDEPVRDRKHFDTRVAKGKTRLMDVAQEICRIAAEILVEYQTLRAKLGQPAYAAWPRAVADIRSQLKELLPPGFLANIPFDRLKHYPRYLKAIAMRLDKIASNPERDANWQQQLARYWQSYQARLTADRARGIRNPRLEEMRWMLEELRVSLWAQQLKTPYPVSFKRVEKNWSEI